MSVHVTYWSDPLCIWAYVSQDKLDRLDRAFGDRLVTAHRVVPVFGSVPFRFTEGSWSEAGPEGRAAVTERIAQKFGHTEVTGRAWIDDPPASSWAPGAAIEAVRLLEDEGEVPHGSTGRYGQRMRQLFFAEARNTARRDVQALAAEQTELPWSAICERLDDGRAHARLWEAHQERERLGIQGSPTWVFDGGRAMLYGNVSEGVLRATVEELLAGEGAGGSKC